MVLAAGSPTASTQDLGYWLPKSLTHLPIGVPVAVAIVITALLVSIWAISIRVVAVWCCIVSGTLTSSHFSLPLFASLFLLFSQPLLVFMAVVLAHVAV